MASGTDHLRLRVEELEREAARLRSLCGADREELEALRDSNFRFRNALETSFMFQGFLSLDGRLLDTNATSLRAIGVELADVRGQIFWTTPWFSPELGAPEIVRDCVRRAAGGESLRVTLSENWPSGRRTFDLAMRRVDDRAGQPDVIIVEAYEKTALLEAEQKLHQSEKMAALGSLLAGVAHELNNPLAIVVTQAVLLRETGPDPRTIARAEKIEAAADRCARTVKSFLAIARQRPISLGPVRIDAIVRSALDLTAYGLRSSGIAVVVDLPADLPDVTGDADQLGQVAMNLIVNAQQALQSYEGPCVLRITAEATAEDVRLVVSDNGPGVPEAIKSRVFDPFFTTKPIGTGTGIGLSLCQSIVQQHHGSLALRDSPGGGATFLLVLPRAATSAGPMAADADAHARDEHARILIVDDEPEIVEALREIVAPLVGRVDAAGSGAEALALIDGGRYDLILSDLRMPELDGAGLYAALSDKGGGRPGPIIFVTGDVLDGRIARFLDDIGVPVLEKPFTPSDVRRLVSEALAGPGSGMPAWAERRIPSRPA